MNRTQSGFTLIELMIVVAIIGILAAVAVPQYQNYVVRSKVSEAIVFLSSPKIAMSEYYITQGVMPTDATEGGFQDIYSVDTDYIKSVSYGKTSTGADLTATLQDLGGDTEDKLITLRASGGSDGITFACYTDLDGKYVPSTCRNSL